jgi:hypothetical protein
MEFDNNSKITIGIIGFIAFGLMLFLILPQSEQEQTIIVRDRGNGTSSGCTDLDCLTDVVLVLPATSQVLTFDGVNWINADVGAIGDTTTCSNIGTGTAYICVEGTNIDFRSILAGTGITASNNSNTVTITNTAPDNTICANVGTGSEIYKDGECNFKTLEDGTGISLIDGTDTVTISNSSPESTTCTNQATGIGICINNDIDLKNLVNGTGISITTNSTHITFTNTGASGESTNCVNVGTGSGIHKTGSNCNANSLIAGTGITITNTTDDYTFASQCANTGTGEPVCESSNNINSLIAGSGITISDTTGDLTISSTVTDTNACTNTGTGEAVCESSNNINSLIAGTGISIADTTGDLTITNTVADTNACTNTGTGEAICESSNNINSLIAGSGITIADTTGDLTVTNSGVTSNTATSPIVASAATGTVNISCPTCSTSTVDWIKLCQTNLGSSATSISCNFTANQHLYANLNGLGTTSSMVIGIQFNNDTGTNYSWRTSVNGGAQQTATSDNQCRIFGTTTIENGAIFQSNYDINNNIAGNRKSAIGNTDTDNALGATNTPSYSIHDCKWGNTSAQIATITFMRISGTGVYNTGTELTVWGYN